MFQVDAPPQSISPSINPAGVVNAASFTAPLAPGAIASVFGVDLGLIDEASLIVPLPTILAGATLIFNGSIPAPQYFGSPTQSNIQIPWELAGTTDASLTVRIGDSVSEAATVPLADFSPGIFSMDQSGAGQGAVLISGTDALAAPLGFNPDSRPASRGEFLEIFATGLGAVTNAPPKRFPGFGQSRFSIHHDAIGEHRRCRCESAVFGTCTGFRRPVSSERAGARKRAEWPERAPDFVGWRGRVKHGHSCDRIGESTIAKNGLDYRFSRFIFSRNKALGRTKIVWQSR